VVNGVSAQFSGLQSSYCLADVQINPNLVPQNPGGTFSGPGVSGNLFSPQAAGIGVHKIKYEIGSGGCIDSTIQTVTIFGLPDASFTDLPDSVCEGAPNIPLIGVTPGGNFIGQGVLTNVSPNVFSPAILFVNNTYQVEYRVTKDGCTNQSTQFVKIRRKTKPVLVFSGIKQRYCKSEAAFSPVTVPAGRYLLNGQEITSVDPSNLNPGNYTLVSVFTPPSSDPCTDSASMKYPFTIIENPKPDLGPDLELESGESVTLDPKVNPPYTWKTPTPALPVGEANKVFTFIPTEAQTISVTASDPTSTCFTTDEINITVKDSLVFYSLFTPNGDGQNDLWVIKGALPNMKVSIFTRWGEKYYSGYTQGETAWSGEKGERKLNLPGPFNTEPPRPGMYFYLVEHPTKADKKWSGWILLPE
jgi:gliding motility-associated-like protein